MTTRIRLGLVLISLLVVSATSFALELPKVIGSNMVLQQKMLVPIWGQAKAGGEISVSFGNQTKSTVADSQGKWKVLLDPMEASDKPAAMTIKGWQDETKPIVLKNILVRRK